MRNGFETRGPAAADAHAGRICCSIPYQNPDGEMALSSVDAKGSPEPQLRSLIEKFDPKDQKLIRSVRSAVRKRLPSANELLYDYENFFVIGYSPTERPTDGIVSIAARADGVRLYLMQGPQLPDPKKLLMGSGKQTRFIRVEAARQLAHPDVEALIVAAIDQAGVPLATREKHPEWRIPAVGPAGASPGEMFPWYFRLSPELESAHRAARDFYTDAAIYLPIHGVLFDDDAFMLADEELRSSGNRDPREKARAIRELLEDVKQAVRAWRPDCRFGRNLHAPVLEHNGVHPGFAQEFDQFIRDYDLTVVMAYPRMEGHGDDAVNWVASLAQDGARRAGRQRSAAAVMFKFQSLDWRTGQWISARELEALGRVAREGGIVQLGLYPVSPSEGDVPPGFFLERSRAVLSAGRGASSPSLLQSAH